MPSSCPPRTSEVEIPKARLAQVEIVDRRVPCPQCGAPCRRTQRAKRFVHHLGLVEQNLPVDYEIVFSRHHCPTCDLHFANPKVQSYVHGKCQYTESVREIARVYLVDEGLPLREASWCLWRCHRVFVPFATLHNWLEEWGKKGRS